MRGVILPETRFGAFDKLNNTNMNQRTLSLEHCAVAMMSEVLMLRSISEHQYCNASNQDGPVATLVWIPVFGMRKKMHICICKYIVMKKNHLKKYLVSQQA